MPINWACSWQAAQVFELVVNILSLPLLFAKYLPFLVRSNFNFVLSLGGLLY